MPCLVSLGRSDASAARRAGRSPDLAADAPQVSCKILTQFDVCGVGRPAHSTVSLGAGLTRSAGLAAGLRTSPRMDRRSPKILTQFDVCGVGRPAHSTVGSGDLAAQHRVCGVGRPSAELTQFDVCGVGRPAHSTVGSGDPRTARCRSAQV